MKKLLAVTGCATGIAHTYMAAEALQKAAKEKNIELKVETRGATGVENAFTEEEILEAHAIIIAADTDVDAGRFEGKNIINVPVAEGIKNPKGLIEQALAMKEKGENDYTEKVQKIKEERSAKRSGPYKHLLNGVSFMIPLVVAGGLLIAISFIFGIKAFDPNDPSYHPIAKALMDIGGGAAFALMVPVLAGYIAYSIAEKPGLTPGLIGGMLASQIGAGFLGGIAAGFLAGYLVKWLKDNIKMPKNLEGIKAILILPVVSTLIVGLLMVFVIGTPVKFMMDGLTVWLTDMSSTNAVLLGVIIGAMMAFDMGGPVNKAAYFFGTGLIVSNIFEPMAAVMAAGMTPPLGLWLATLLAPKKYTLEEREAGKAASILGISFITEGAIPFAAADPLRVIPSIMAGSAVAGGLSMLFDVGLRAPHGGIFVLFVPNVVENLLMYVIAIAAGTIITALLLNTLKRTRY